MENKREIMKTKVLLCLVLFTIMILMVGCSNKNDYYQGKNSQIESNTSVGYLKFYAPSDFSYNDDLRGLAYTESQKKVYVKGDYSSDPYNVIYLIGVLEYQNRDVKDYIDEINNKLPEKDVKYVLKTNNKNQVVYARENYIVAGNINYTYILGKRGDIYVVIVRGPQDKRNEIEAVIGDIYNSLYIS